MAKKKKESKYDKPIGLPEEVHNDLEKEAQKRIDSGEMEEYLGQFKFEAMMKRLMKSK